MFLKLPKLFNFHILRLAAEGKISPGKRKREDKERQKKRQLRAILVKAAERTDYLIKS